MKKSSHKVGTFRDICSPQSSGLESLLKYIKTNYSFDCLQAVHLISAHGLDAANAKEVAEARTGKSAARTDLTLDWVLKRKRFQQELLTTDKT